MKEFNQLMRCPVSAFMISISVLVTGCAETEIFTDRYDLPISILGSLGFHGIWAGGEKFPVLVYGKVNQPNAEAVVYFEGDGFSWLSRKRQSTDPTPKNPIAARLAAVDKSKNVFWVARPCQYAKKKAWWENCDPSYWSTGRYAPEIIDAVSKVIEEIKLNNQITGFHFVGFSGGAAVAALVGAGRKDLESFQSVAGNLDHAEFSEIHAVTPLSGSLNPINSAFLMNKVPQRHIVGSSDQIIPRKVVNSWLQHSSNYDCIQVDTVDGMSHTGEWQHAWQLYSDIKPVCRPII